MTPRAQTLAWSAVRHLLLLCGAAFILLPFVWMISTASKPQTEIFTTDLHFIPYSFALWDNLSTAFAKANLWRFLLNGVVVTVSIFALQVLVALAGVGDVEEVLALVASHLDGRHRHLVGQAAELPVHRHGAVGRLAQLREPPERGQREHGDQQAEQAEGQAQAGSQAEPRPRRGRRERRGRNRYRGHNALRRTVATIHSASSI